jgi:muconolactone delta-isomerase
MEYLVTMTTHIPDGTSELTPLTPHPSDPATMST